MTTSCHSNVSAVESSMGQKLPWVHTSTSANGKTESWVPNKRGGFHVPCVENTMEANNTWRFTCSTAMTKSFKKHKRNQKEVQTTILKQHRWRLIQELHLQELLRYYLKDHYLTFCIFFDEISIQVPTKYDKFQISMGPDLTFQISDNDEDIQVRISCITYLWVYVD